MSAIINALKGSLESDPQNWETRLALIEACNGEGLYNEAVEFLNQAESLPGDDAGLVVAGKCYFAVGASEQAHGIYLAALEVNPDNEDARNAIKEIEAAHAAEADGSVPVAVLADEDDVGDVEEAVAAVATPSPVAKAVAARAGQQAPAPVIVRSVNPEDIDPELIAEAEFIHQAEEESQRKRAASMRRDRVNAVALTVLLHVLVLFALMQVVSQAVRNAPPQIVASTTADSPPEAIDNETLKRPTQTSAASSSAMADIVSVDATSSFSLSNVKVDTAANMALGDTGIDFAPSMDMGVETSSDSKMMFGQKMEGDVLGVILDVSGSMAEYLPYVVREVDKNFKNAPIVYVRDVVLRRRSKDPEVITIIPDEVRPFDEDRNHTPYWFLWYDLPRKAPQRYVDRLIETMKSRPNQFLALNRGGSDMVSAAIDFLVEQKIDSLYIFSDFEDFVDEDLAQEIGQGLGRRRIRTYVQPAKKSTENLAIMTKKLANRTLGRQMPSLVSIMQPPDDTPKPLTLQKPKDMLADAPVNYATPRKEMFGKEFYDFRPNKLQEITRLSEPEYDAVFYGPQARVEIFLKNEKGEYLQHPIEFYYWSWKRDPERMKDPKYYGRRRKFLRVEEDPTFDGKEIVWKMVLEDELKFQVHLYLGRKGMNATYVAEPPKDGTPDSANIYFRIPRLAFERKDIYYGQDLPPEGLDLDHVRIGVRPNTVVFNLPRKDRNRYKATWALDGFVPGYNTRHFDELIRVMPNGIRDVVVSGPSFGPRKFHARTTSSKILLTGGAGRRDIEPWESFWFALVRSADTRERFTKTEAISIEIE